MDAFIQQSEIYGVETLHCEIALSPTYNYVDIKVNNCSESIKRETKRIY